MRSKGEKIVAIAQLTQTSIGPSRRSTSAAAASTACGSAMSVGMAMARPPPCSTSRVAASSPSRPRASRPTQAPRAPKARAVARPTPALDPVMTTTSAMARFPSARPPTGNDAGQVFVLTDPGLTLCSRNSAARPCVDRATRLQARGGGRPMAWNKERIERVEARAYTIPTAAPEADGTFSWKETTIIVVEATGGGKTGLGYTYSHKSIAGLITSALAEVVCGTDPLDVPAAHEALVGKV